MVHTDCGASGLIRYKIVIHCFVDGFSRYILGLRAHDNNRAQTVLDLFLTRVVESAGLPDKVRGDHGVENLKVAEYMRRRHGPENKPYLWGAYVFLPMKTEDEKQLTLSNICSSRDNTRSERLWVDMTRGVGAKWKLFLWELEDSGDLDVANHHHIWLVHVLFLPHINYDLSVWAETWNLHKLQIKGERTRSPHDMFFFGALLDGVQPLRHGNMDNTLGVEDDDMIDLDVVDEVEADGNDLEADIPVFEGRRDNTLENPFIVPTVPSNLSRVDCDPPESSLTRDQRLSLATFLESCPWVHAVEMDGRRVLWRVALAFCTNMFPR